MGLVRNREPQNVPFAGSSNRYLTDQRAGFALLAKIISAKPAGIFPWEYKLVNRLIDDRLLMLSGRLDLKNELELYEKLDALSDRLYPPEKYRILKNCSVIGLGGQFSSGKSAFLNSLLGEDFPYKLPEKQTPSTAVATYVVPGAGDSVYAYTHKGAKLPLDSDALEAISHEFRKIYGLGLARYLSFITVYSAAMNRDLKRLAFLDTPGYNNADGNLIQSQQDAQQAFSQLWSIDHLIWLVDVTNGTLRETDIDFLHRLDRKTPILIVINKCDLKPDDDSGRVLETVREAAKSAGLPLFGVIRYSALDPGRFGGKEKVWNFLRYAQNSGFHTEDIGSQIAEIVDKLKETFASTRDGLENERNSIGEAIFRSRDIANIRSLIMLYGGMNSEIRAIIANERNFDNTVEEIRSRLSAIGRSTTDE